MTPERRRQLLLAVLTVILAAVAYRVWSGASDAPSLSPDGASQAGPSTGRRSTGVDAPDVRLRELAGSRPTPLEGRRNLFRFRPKPPPPISRPTSSRVSGPSGPLPLPQPPPITLRFIGVVERPERSEKIAVLRDLAGHLISGPEGAIIEGRFRILRIGAESIEMVYLDGRGRQTIRLSGG